MLVRRHENAAAFLDEALEFLLRDEPENHLMIGLAQETARADAAGKLPSGEAARLFATVSGPAGVAGCAMQMPLFLTLTRAPDEALEALAAELANQGVDLPGVSGPAGIPERFAEAWQQRTGRETREGMRQCIYGLEKVTPPPRTSPGRLRRAADGDLDQVAPWVEAFFDEVGMPVADPRRMAEAKIAEGAVYLWDDGGPVTMAAWAGPTPNGVRVNLVYTPHELRGRGYAAACVAALSQRLLDEGRKSCFLYTDLANPASNKLYTRIGYRRVSDVHEVRFTGPGPNPR